jgi:lysophospholipase L1-like esterase
MISDQLPPAARLDAQYTRVGGRDPFIDGSAARSIVEALPAQINGYDAAVAQRAAGFTGCWVLELGTNDAANIAHGSLVDQATRIDRMMSVIGSEPVVWVDAVSRVDQGDYASDNMQMWDVALDEALGRYPNLHVFAWSKVARDEWFQSDSVHYTTDGYTAFARSLADAVAAAFPG